MHQQSLAALAPDGGVATLLQQRDILVANEPDTSREGDKWLDWKRAVEAVEEEIKAQQLDDTATLDALTAFGLKKSEMKVVAADLKRTREELAKGGFPFTEISFAEMSNETHVARGGFGEVSRVICRGIVMARKKVNTATQTAESVALRFVKKEARAMSAVQHPNLVLLTGVCIERGQLSILMEFAELGTLREQLDKDLRMPPWRRFQLLLGVVNGVRMLHAHTPNPIVHGDLKSLNVLITIHAHRRLGG